MALLVALALIASSASSLDRREARFPLYSSTVALAGPGRPVEVGGDPTLLIPGTRVLVTADDAEELAAEQRAWLASGSVPVVPGLEGSTLVSDALLDLHVLSAEHGVAVAGWAHPWRFVWPRDAALVATAFARTGHLDDAERVIDFLQEVQPESGLFHARYHPDGSGVPDARGVQTDGLGWALWATQQVAEQWPAGQRAAFVARHAPLVDRSTEAIQTLIATPSGLPPASSDYWERSERQGTLATVALLRAGLESAAWLYGESGDPASAADAAASASRAGATITRAFGPHFPRYAGGAASSVDLGVSFLLPPFSATVNPSAATAWRDASGPMRRAAGGLSPGGSWRDDGVSWNTATSTRALTAAFLGDTDETLEWLGWLDAHRTVQGSLPEKVLYDGQPASVAPLGWAAAAVIIAADRMEPGSDTAAPR